MLFWLFIVYTATSYLGAKGEIKFYREGYKYIESLNGFYKIYKAHSTWSKANEICGKEGANLFYPKSLEDVIEIVSLLSFLNGTQSSDLTLNKSSNDHLSLSNVLTKRINQTLDGIPISDLYTNWGPTRSENNKYPFICKKIYDSFEWNQECNMPISDYTYNAETDRCYKFHLDPKNWTEANEICKQEQSYLAIINSHTEARILVKLTEGSPKESVTGGYLRGMVHLGFSNQDNLGWKTIEGIKLEESGYAQWSRDQPDGPGRGVKELCGSMFYGGELNDIGCQVRGFYICEHEIHTFSSLLGYRLERN